MSEAPRTSVHSMDGFAMTHPDTTSKLMDALGRIEKLEAALTMVVSATGDVDRIAEILYFAYWGPTAMTTGRDIAPWSGQPDANKQAWRSVARAAVATLTKGDPS